MNTGCWLVGSLLDVGEECHPARRMLVVGVPDEWICCGMWMRD